MVGAVPAIADDAAPHQDAAPNQDVCVFTNRLQHWSDVDSKTAIIDAGLSRKYKVTFLNDCRDMRFAIYAKVHSRPGICLSSGDSITFGRPRGIETTCFIQSVERVPPPQALTPASAPAEPH